MDKEDAITPQYDVIQCVLSNGQSIIGQMTDTDENGDDTLSLKNIYCLLNLGHPQPGDAGLNMFELPIGDFVTLYHYIPGMELGKIYGISKKHIISMFIASEELTVIYSEVLVHDHMDILGRRHDHMDILDRRYQEISWYHQEIEKMEDELEKEQQAELDFKDMRLMDVATNLRPHVEDEKDSGNDNIIKFNPKLH